MKNKSKKKNKLFYLFIWLFLTIILLSTSTYAWFTANRVVTIDGLNVHVQAEGGLEISTDGTNWKSVISTTDIIGVHDNTYPTSVNQLPSTLSPVSTGGNVSNGKLQMFYGVAENDITGKYILTSTKSDETEGNGVESNGRFIAFDLFVRVPSNVNLYLTDSSFANYSGESSVGIENAVRFAFLVEGNVTNGTSLSTIQALNNGTSSSLYIWEPNYDVHTVAAVANAYDVYGISTTTTGGVPLSYDGVIAEFDRNRSIYLENANYTNYNNLFKAVTVNYTTVAGFNEYQSIFSLNAGITKIRVYIWIEGQDVDCENNASIGDISFQLQFSINPS